MPYIAHNFEWTLGVGETPAEARDHMLEHHPDEAPIVEPATRTLVDSILDDPFLQPDGRLLFEQIPWGSHFIDGVACLTEEFAVLKSEEGSLGSMAPDLRAGIEAARKRGTESMGLTAAGVRAEIDQLRPTYYQDPEQRAAIIRELEARGHRVSQPSEDVFDIHIDGIMLPHLPMTHDDVAVCAEEASEHVKSMASRQSNY